jgi:hypothetical protein
VSGAPVRRRGGAAVLAAVAAAVGVWVLVIVGSVRATPGWEGWLTGVFAGGFAALLTLLGGLILVLKLVQPKARGREAERPFSADDDLGQILADLEANRKLTIARINRSAMWRVPLGVAASIGLWVLAKQGDDPPDSGDLVIFMLVGGGAGYAWGAYALEKAYRELYKSRVLPKLAAAFGDLAWRRAQPPLDDFRRHRLFPDWDAAHAEDEIFGTYRGLSLSIVELKLTRGSGKNRRTVFMGLTAAVELPRGLSGITVIAPDRGPFGNFAERLRGGPCEPVRLEDPEFEKAYEVYGSDQIGARALLTPAFMTRFLELARSGRFGAPAALVQDNRLLMALSRNGGDLFEPPSYFRPAAAGDALRRLQADIEAVLRAADAVIDLDQAGRLQPAAPKMGA